MEGKNLKILLAPTFEIASQAAKQNNIVATVEAEYGDDCVEGKLVTLAHHGPRSMNPAPCNTQNVPVLNDGDVVLVSHLDLDTLGGLLALEGIKPDSPEFWKYAEFIDVNGPQHMYEVPQNVQDMLNAFYAWSETQGRVRYTELTDVTDKVNAANATISLICDSRDPQQKQMIQAGKDWVENATKAVEACLYQEDDLVRAFISDGVFCAGSYYSPTMEKPIPATVTFNKKTQAITVAFFDAERDGLNACEIVQKLWGPLAGSRAGIAGSPRGQEMTMGDFYAAVSATKTAVQEKLIDKLIPETNESLRNAPLGAKETALGISEKYGIGLDEITYEPDTKGNGTEALICRGEVGAILDPATHFCIKEYHDQLVEVADKDNREDVGDDAI